MGALKYSSNASTRRGCMSKGTQDLTLYMWRNGWRVHIAIALTTAPLLLALIGRVQPFNTLIELLIDET